MVRSPRRQSEQRPASDHIWRELSSPCVRLVAPAVVSCLVLVKLNEVKCPGMVKPLASKDETMAAWMSMMRVDSLEEQPLVVKYLKLNCLHHPRWQSRLKAELQSKVSVVLMRAASLDVPVRTLCHLLWGMHIRDEICNPETCRNHFDISYRAVSCDHRLSPRSAT